MQHNYYGDAKILEQILNQNVNPLGYKQIVNKVCKSIEEKTFWYFTSGQADFLNKIYDKQINSEVLKHRIRQITIEQMDAVVSEIMSGKLRKDNYEEADTLQVGVGLQNFYDQLPDEIESAKKNKERLMQINEDFKRFKQIMEQKKQLIERKKQQRNALQEEFRRSLEQEKREQKKAQIRKHLQQLKKVQQQRKEQTQKFKSFLKQYKQSKPLYVAMQQAYKEKVVLPSIQQSRRKLESMPHRTKPSLQEINDHERYYLERKAAKPEKFVLLNQTIDVSYKSHFYKKEEQKLKDQKQFEELGPAWDFLQKQKRYSQFIKEKVKPKICPKLRESLEQSIKEGHHHAKQSPDRAKVIQVGKNYLQYMRSLEKRRIVTPMEPVQMTKQSRYYNYLEQLKVRSQHQTSSSMDWQKDMRDRTASHMQKRQKVLMKSKQLQQRAKRDEKLVSHYNYGCVEQIIEKKKQIDDTLLSSVKAKVAVLKDAHSNI